MPTTRLDIEYDGRAFAGWARQPGRRTVQDELERALAQILGESHDLVVAGRTDAGVHAQGQVCSYPGPVAPLKGLNALLPADVAVRAATVAPDGFNARRDAVSRAYRFRVLTRAARSPFDTGFALHHPAALDRSALDACAAALVGTHDFRAFTPTETGHSHFRREMLEAAWVDEGPGGIAFVIRGRTFLRHMNRVLVGTMLEVGRGRRTVPSFLALLDGAPRSAAGPTAAPHGLSLTAVRYPGD